MFLTLDLLKTDVENAIRELIDPPDREAVVAVIDCPDLLRKLERSGAPPNVGHRHVVRHVVLRAWQDVQDRRKLEEDRSSELAKELEEREAWLRQSPGEQLFSVFKELQRLNNSLASR